MPHLCIFAIPGHFRCDRKRYMMDNITIFFIIGKRNILETDLTDLLQNRKIFLADYFRFICRKFRIFSAYSDVSTSARI